MPTIQVLPGSVELLQEIADALWKAKKVVVVTGAGISTNSGIPDFRSKNGLYSMIQAQFEASSSKDERDTEDERHKPGRADDDNENDDSNIKKPASKRQRTGLGDDQEAAAQCKQDDTSPPRRRRSKRIIPARDEGDTRYYAQQDADIADSIVVQLPALDPEKYAQKLSTPKRVDGKQNSLRLATESLPLSSSPLSSPPSFMFDPTDKCGISPTSVSPDDTSLATSPVCSPDVESDFEDSTQPTSSTQTSLSTQSSFTSNKSTLPYIKGRDLFDASIWADPIKTSVFYTFATTLRQKVRDVVPTRSHEFISHLRDTNKLVRCYTQNIDEIEEKVGLSTSLFLGPGKKGRFSTRSHANRASLNAGHSTSDKAKSSAKSQADLQDPASSQESQNSASTDDLGDSHVYQPQSQSQSESQFHSQSPSHPGTKSLAQSHDPCYRGVDCVFLHGSLRLLRCFRCGQTTPWDEAGLEDETMSGRQPSCPRCAGATAAREGRGKRALAVGKLRPDIVLYGEDHPNAHLISPIVQHDLSLTPDMLLILGTSLKVHGLKVLVREFAKAVHSRCGKVVFVNFTKPPESVWSDIIDYWVQWDCDTWVEDLKQKKPAMWLPPGSVTEGAKRKQKIPSTESAAKASKQNSGSVETSERHESKCTITLDGSANSVDGGAMGGQELKNIRGQAPKQKSEKASPQNRDADRALPSSTLKGPLSQSKQEAAQGAGSHVPGEKKKRRQRQKRNASQPTHDSQAESGVELRKMGQQLAFTADEPNERPPAQSELEINLSSVSSRDDSHTLGALPTTYLPSLRRPKAIPLAEIPINILPSTATAPRPGQDKYSIRSAVKANPRVRQPRKIFESGGGRTGGPLLSSVQSAAPLKQQHSSSLPPTPTSTAPPVVQPQQDNRHQTQELKTQPREQDKALSHPQAMAGPPFREPAKDPSRSPAPQVSLTGPSIGAGWSSVDRMAEQLRMSMSTSWSARTTSESMASTLAANADQLTTVKVASTHAPPLRAAVVASMTPRTSLPPIRQVFGEFLPKPKMMSHDDAFFHQDPLGTCYSYPPPWPHEPQEWSCANQVEREADEQWLAATADRCTRRSRRRT
ncbi:NAD-dependent deacetylase hst3 [Sporothrix epigloea]|uniref:NAD-dependent deacetylase hst3 n=1 Tax=Sporothrix epigloea TaxID=1892477 RepID=A0ABP0D381_9PEZI